MSDANRPAAPTAPSGSATVTESRVIEALRTCYDPEVPVNIYELGLIYGITLDPGGQVGIRMTLTAPNCPAAQELPAQVEAAVAAIPGVTGAKVDIVFDPPWNTCMMSEAARLELGM